MYDYFAAALRCSKCGHQTDGREHTNMQTSIRGDAEGIELRKGHVFESRDLQIAHLIDAGYLLLRQPEAHFVCLLNPWQCPSCNADQWAQVDIRDCVVERIIAVVMNQETLADAHFIDEAAAELLAANLAQMAAWELDERGLDPVRVLRERLPV